MKKNQKIAIYPGTFDPITLGHIDIIERASNLFDKLIVSIAINSEKQTLFSIQSRLEMIKKSIIHIPNIEVNQFSGLLVNYAKEVDATAIIRGIRALSDYEYEFKMALMNRSLDENITTIFLVAHQKYTHLSSSLVREVASLNGEINQLVPHVVVKKMIKKFEK